MKKHITILAAFYCLVLASTQVSAQCPFTVNAGIDQTVCSSASSIVLNGTTNTNPGTVNWTSSGNGTFSPASNVLNPSYIPSSTDKSNGSVTITLTESGICTPVTDQMVITIHAIPTASAGVDQTICSTSSSVNIYGTISNATGGTWTSSGNGAFGVSTNMNTSYSPTSTDKNAGYVYLTLATTGTGPCTAVSDMLIVYITTAPVADAGIDKSICVDASSANLSGSVGGSATGGTWTMMTPVYTPSQTDKNNGSVILKLTTSNSTVCASSSDLMALTIASLPIANAGADETTCNNSMATLNGTVSGSATGGIWSSNGSGTFGNSSSINTSYTPSAADYTAGSVVLTLITSGSGACTNPAQDQMLLTVSTCTGISSALKNSEVEIYPNPGSGIIHIQAESNSLIIISAEIFNAEGKLLGAIPLSNSQIDMSGVDSGLYYLKLFDSEGKQLMRKLVIQ